MVSTDQELKEMGVKSFSHELKLKVSPSRLFEALVTQPHHHLPRITTNIKSLEFVEGDAMVPGCVYQTNFPDDAHFKSAKNKVEVVDSENYICKFTTIDGDALGDKIEKICHELKFEAAEDGGCVVKLSSEYHTKGDFQLTDHHIEAAKAQASGLYKACEEYLIANPNVCV